MILKILFLTAFLPSKIAGGHNYTRLLLNKLAERGFDVDLLYCKYPYDPFYKNPDEKKIKVLKVCKITSFVKLINAVKVPFFHPIFTIRFSWRVLFFLRKEFKKNRYDLIYLDHPQMYLYGAFFPEKKILMAHDVMAQRYERSSSGMVSKIVKMGEKFFMGMQKSTVFSFSDKDRLIIKSLYGYDSRVTNFFIDEKILQLPLPNAEDYYVFFGKWDRDDNLDGMKWFFSEVYEKLEKPVKVYVIGVALPEEYKQELKKFSNVEYLGFVDNPYEIIANAKAMFAPLFSGAGVKVKVIESLACGTPVIGNEISFEGISDEYRSFMISAETPNEYVEQTSKINFNLNQRMSFREKFLKKYNSQSVLSFLERL